MTRTDKAYIGLIKDIMDNGTEKNTRAGKTKSVFGRQLRFDLKESFPLLTVKKVTTKVTLIELLWFLQRTKNSHGSVNIHNLVENNVKIWNDDAYRFFLENLKKWKGEELAYWCYKIIGEDDINGREQSVYGDVFDILKPYDDFIEWAENINKDEFIDLVKQQVEVRFSGPNAPEYPKNIYRFGDLGPVYGKQWRSFGHSDVDQIESIIEKLKTNPDDRRMMCLAYNPDEIKDMALPPCHVMFQFYTRVLSKEEREKYGKERGLSLMWTQRSVDTNLGLPVNIASYAALTHMIAKLVDMVPDELVGSLGDCHIYENQFDGTMELLQRKGTEAKPQLIIHGDQNTVNDFKYEDFEFIGYESDGVIKFPLNVGL